MQSLKDKLLKAGLVSKEQADQVKEPDPSKAPAAPQRFERAERPERPERPAHPRSDDRRDHGRPGGSGRPNGPGGSPGNRDSRERFNRPRTSQPGSGSYGSGPSRPRTDAPRIDGPLPKFAPLPGSKAAHREEAKKQLELARTLREMVVQTEVPLEVGEITFHFVTRKNKLRRLELSESQARLLSEGKLAIVERQDPDKIEHALVPAETAEAMKKLFEKSVRFFNHNGEAVGFLTEEEISGRQNELNEPEHPDPAPEHDAAESAETETKSESKSEPITGSWITIKRSPLS